VLADLPGLGPGPAGIGAGLRGVGPVGPAGGVPAQRHAVAAYLPADRGQAAAQFGSYLPDGRLLPHPGGDVDAVRLPQIPRRALRRPHRADRRRCSVLAGGRPAVAPPLARPTVDTHAPTGF